MHLEAHSFFHMNFGFKVFGNKMCTRYCGTTRKLESVSLKSHSIKTSEKYFFMRLLPKRFGRWSLERRAPLLTFTSLGLQLINFECTKIKCLSVLFEL